MPEKKSLLIISPRRGWGQLGLGELWDSRDLLWFNVWREVKTKYRQMALGPIWVILQPIITMVIFSILFGRIAGLSSEGVPYILMVYASMVPWKFFENASNASVNSLVDQMGVISKVYFPRMIIPLSSILGGLVDFAISFSVFLAIMLAMGYVPGWQALFIPFFILMAMATSLAVGLWAASLTVRFRDLRLVVQHGLQVAMFLTPVAISSTEFHTHFPNWIWLLKLNPMYWVVEGFRWSMLGIGNAPELYMLYPLGILVVALITGAHLFRRTERSIVDLL